MDNSPIKELENLETEINTLKSEYNRQLTGLMERRKRLFKTYYKCECGSMTFVSNKGNHEMSQKHRFYMVKKGEK